MDFHDYKLNGYSVTDGGASIEFFLAYDYPERPLRRSAIKFSGVVLYHFVHTQPAIITGLEEVPVAELIDEVKDDLGEFNRTHGLWGWGKSIDEYKSRLETDGFKAWSIDSAIGFAGYVVGRDVRQLPERT